jgi:signal peptidase I
MTGMFVKVVAFVLLAVGVLALQERYEIRKIDELATLMQPAVRPRTTKIFRTAEGAVPPRGAVVWFEHARHPGRMLLSRALAIPGDRVAIEAGRAVRDGLVLTEDYAEKRIEGEDLAEIVVPEGHVYVLNDVRGDPGSPALDSRRLGPIPLALVNGWSMDRVAEDVQQGKGTAGSGAGSKAGRK